MNDKALIAVDPIHAIHLPMSERVLDKLADILLASDEILDMLRFDERIPDATTVAVQESVRGVYERVNELMKTLAD